MAVGNGNIRIENARLLFRNFSGKEGRFNPKGNRNFCVVIEDPKMAETLKHDGWNIKYLQPKDPEDNPTAILPISVSYRNIPPKIMLITGESKQLLSEDTINVLDWAEISSVDLIIRPYNWENNGGKGIKAYVKTMYVIQEEDEFEKKYYNLEESTDIENGTV